VSNATPTFTRATCIPPTSSARSTTLPIFSVSKRRASVWGRGPRAGVPAATIPFPSSVARLTGKIMTSSTIRPPSRASPAQHAMTHINSSSGNGDYTIDEPIHYPFATSENPVLQWLNNQLVKAKPDFHKKTFLKPFHRSEEFCSVCHKVGIPQEVNHYKEFLRGQNHNDSFLLSGVSGIGPRSFYYPPMSKTRCAECHIPLQASNDFGARDFDGSGIAKIHNHTFLGGNTGAPSLAKFPGYEDVVKWQEKFLQGGIDGKSPALRVDIFGLK